MNLGARVFARVFALSSALALALAAGASTAAPGFEGNAHLKVERVSTLDGRSEGPARAAAQSLIDGCNGVRQTLYDLPPVAPPASALEGLDRRVVEKFFDNGRAATYVTGTALELVDFRRWSAAARATTKPDPAPDCAAHALREQRSGTIWRDGRRIELRFDAKRAISMPAPQDFVVRPLMEATEFAGLPKTRHGLQSCSTVRAPGLVEFAGGTACIWTAFPFAAYLNFPWAFEAERNFGMPKPLHDVDRLLDVELNRIVDGRVFEVPAGFAMIGPK
jgi:hypothetical protein